MPFIFGVISGEPWTLLPLSVWRENVDELSRRTQQTNSAFIGAVFVQTGSSPNSSATGGYAVSSEPGRFLAISHNEPDPLLISTIFPAPSSQSTQWFTIEQHFN